MVSFNEMLVRRFSTSKLAMTQLAEKLTTAFQNKNESQTVNLFTVNSDKIKTKTLLDWYGIC